MAVERVLSNLNLISFKTEGGLQNHIDELQDGDLAFTPDNSLKGVLFDFKWADHLLNDMSWLRADTFSWQSGDVYVAAYNHLVDDAFSATINGEKYYAWDVSVLSGIRYYTKSFTPNQGDIVYEKSGTGEMIATEYTVTSVAGNELTLSDGRIVRADLLFVFTDTIGDTTIKYYRAADKHKICLPDQEDKVLALYNKTGVAWYYILDTENKQFKLPRSKHNKYADTVPVVGNGMALGITNGVTSRAISATTVHDSQTTTALMLSKNEPDNMAVGTSVSVTNAGGNDLGTGKAYGVSTTPDSSGLIAQQEQDTDQYKYLYFYVGNFERDAVEQTAGVTVETLNSKADSDLGNIPANYDYVVESQLPTAENGYTWYRKYKSGWVEQGGRVTGVSQDAAVTLPIEMANSYYSVSITPITGVNNAGGYESGAKKESQTTTGFHIAGIANSANGNHSLWQVSGVSAQ